MSILSTVKKGTISIKTASGYVKLLPRTLASLVSMDDGTTVENKINTINTNLSAIPKPEDFIIEHGYANKLENYGWQWEYIKLNNGLMFLWRCSKKVDSFVTSNSSTSGWYYSGETTWNTLNSVGMSQILSVNTSIDRCGNSGLPMISVVESKIVDGGFFEIKFVIVGNKNTTYDLSVSCFVIGRWDSTV